MTAFTKILGQIKWLPAILVVLALATGCVLTKPNALLSSRVVEDPPNLVGRYLDDKGKELRVLGQGGSSNNTFVAYPPNKKNPITVTLERLAGPRFLVQLRPEGETKVGLTVAEIELPKVTIYVFPNAEAEVMAIAKKRNVTVNKDGVITEYHSVPDIIGLFADLFSVNNKEAMVFIKQK
ncbi:MAG: hypothetical protein LBS60_01655 [Deltaproteobacteria bacterium]|jgi:hypothetical protein|nr:hypothetical protein [Deltaproteobacteria bacterium]